MSESPSPLLLVIEDNDEDFAILKRIVEQEAISCQIDRCVTGDEALEYLLEHSDTAGKEVSRRLTRPSLILLDLSLPGTDGSEILQFIKQQELLKAIPIVVLAGDMHQKEVNLLYQQGVSGYLVKQVDGAKFRRKMQLMIEYWFVANRLPT